MKEALTTGSKAQAEGTKSRILKVALELFAEFGFAGVSTRKIADEARCNCASVCYHFGGKKKLYLECLQHLKLEGNSELKKILQPPQSREDFEERLLKFCEAFAKYGAENAPTIKLLMNELNAKKKLPLKGHLLETIEGMLNAFLLESQALGIISKNIDIAVFSKMIFSTILSQKFFKVSTSEIINEKEFAMRLIRNCTSDLFGP